MTELITTIVPYAVLLSHVLLVFLVLAIIFRDSWGRVVVSFVGTYALLLGLLVSLGAMVGSLFYSEIVGFEACVLCWWQRIFLYPQVVLFSIALWKKDASIFVYTVALTALAGVVALYQSYVNWGGGSLLSCTAEEGACARLYVMEFGYITIPAMSLTVAIYLLLIPWMYKIYRKNFSASSL
jgi:disulfide bond formation protein DsbB